MRTTIKLLVILALVIVTLNFVTPVSAHPPEELELRYSDGILYVDITHISAQPELHYIQTVEVYLNNQLEIEETYTSQPTSPPINHNFTYEYDLPAYPGDTIRVTVTCSYGGNKTETLVVPGDQIPLEIEIVASSTQVESNKDLQITINIDSDDDPISEADITLESDGGGSFSDVNDKGNGEYTSTFTAPEVTSDTTLTITAKATKAGYIHDEDDIEITVTPVSSKKDDDDSTPGFEGALTVLVLACMVLIYFVNRRRNK